MQTAGGYRANFSTGWLEPWRIARLSQGPTVSRIWLRAGWPVGDPGARMKGAARSSRSSRFSTGASDLGELFEAVPHHGQRGAEILVYETK